MSWRFPLFPRARSWCVAVGRCGVGLGSAGEGSTLPALLPVAAGLGPCLLRQVQSLFKSAGPMGAAPFKHAAVGRVSHGNPAARLPVAPR